MKLDNIKNLIDRCEAFSALDRQFANLMLQLAGLESPELWFAAALVSEQTRQQHVCFDLSRLSDPEFALEIFGENEQAVMPSPQAVREALHSAKVVGKPGDFQPLILDSADRLYLYRYWQYEQNLAEFILNRAEGFDAVDSESLRQSIGKYFENSNPDSSHSQIESPLTSRSEAESPHPSGSKIESPPSSRSQISFGNVTKPDEKEADWQQIAAAVALSKRFCVISGGPGTGKTHAIGIILALLIEHLNMDMPIIKLAAPTGKAAVRLQEAIKSIKEKFDFPDHVNNLIPEEASTVHRLLGTKLHSPYFRHNVKNPLEVDVVVLDEASMVDLPLMAKLVQALPDHARMILLGDQYQLASVEAGAVLADICEAGGGKFSPQLVQKVHVITGYEIDSDSNFKPMNDCVVELEKNYRFEGGGMLKLSQAVNAGDSKSALEVLKNGDHDDVLWHPFNAANLWHNIIEKFTNYPTDLDPETIFQQFEQLRILCAVREGPQGVRQTNTLIEHFVKEKLKVKQGDDWYAGQPLLITKNDYNLGLFNGDLGIILPDSENGDELRAFFQTSEGEFRKIRPFRLPEFETAYAMTIHKSQGSEFEEVLMILPEKDSPILTRELIYTAVTRASKKVQIWGVETIFHAAIERRIKRSSGLRDALS